MASKAVGQETPAATTASKAVGQERPAGPGASQAVGQEPPAATTASKTVGQEQPARKKRRAERMSSEEMMRQPLGTPPDDLQEVSMQPDQSLGHILSKDKSKSAGSSVEAAVHASVQSKGTEQNKEALAEGPSDVGANLQSRHQTVVKTFTQLSKQLQRAATLARSYEEELRGRTTISAIDELQEKLKVVAVQVDRLEKDNGRLKARGDRYRDSMGVTTKALAESDQRVTLLKAQLQEKERDLAAAEAEAAERKKALAASEARVAEKDKALAASEARVVEKDTSLAAAEARFNEAAAALTELTAKYAADREASERLAQEKAKEFEDFKAAMVVVLNEKFEEGFQTCDVETKEVVELVDPNFDWDKFEKILADKEKEKEAEKAGPSGQDQTK